MLIVQTTKRQGAAYLSATLRGIGGAGPRPRGVVSDGPLSRDELPWGWEAVELPWRGARATGWACMRMALERGAEDLILLQDDIEVCSGGVELMVRAPVPEDCIATTFYSGSSLPGLQPKSPGEPRLIVVRASGTAQALKLPRRSLEYLCAQDPTAAPNHIRPEPHLFDDVLFAFARASAWPNVAHLVPNPVRHVGAVSACGTRRAFHQPWAVAPGATFPGDVASLHEARR